MVRSMVGAEVVSVDQIAYDEFVRSLVQPTSIAVLEMYPLTGNAVMEMTPQLVFPPSLIGFWGGRESLCGRFGSLRILSVP